MDIEKIIQEAVSQVLSQTSMGTSKGMLIVKGEKPSEEQKKVY
jgi:hypothetical protein